MSMYDPNALDAFPDSSFILPSQIERSNRFYSSPEIRLAHAVLELAIEDYRRCRNPTHYACFKRHDAARSWLFGDNDSIYSCPTVCDALSIDYVAFTERLR